ncbi:putative disease resistance RPP13-like protein 1 isoform X1 [Humulus lupulus]|uniref:putative disease resistance RPP13-like protein 1 isoform X1 n=1 Tax=Humulus lupulus TaxID=3486 RepID=UPI002B40604B|nr:putative disease resistance RPP13-like protein 1 isoform X1 [Humulus lupulus]
MHDLVHDLAMFVSGEFCLAVNDTKISKCTSKVRHLSFRQEGQVAGPMKFEDLSITNKGLCTFLLLWKRGHCPYSMEHLLELLLSTRGCLRVLSIADGYMTKLPDSIGKLKYLKFLELDFCMIKEIPSTICDLYNLETLLLERCYSVTRLPNNIGNLMKLRHFCIPFVLVEMPLQFGLMKNLQTLNKFVVGKNKNSGIKLLKEFQDLHGTLTIWGLENICSVEDVLEANLKNKKFLKLHFKWDDRHEHDDLEREKEILGALEAHENLKEFNVHGYKGSSFPSWIGDHLFSNLTMVKLEDCKNCIFLPSLGQLPALKDLSIQHFYSVVRIDSEFYHSATSVGSSAANTKPFRSLERLSFENMTELQEWSFIEGGVFPRLKFLDFFNCKRLKVSLLPHYFPSLRELVIDTCEKLMPLLKTRADPLMDSSFPSLEILQIARCDGQELLLEGGLPTSLKDFVIQSCKNLVAIDNECFQHLNSLENLQIGECSQLRRWPNELPTSLSDLVIFGCKLLKPRLQRDISNNINVTILEYEHDTTKDDLYTSSRWYYILLFLTPNCLHYLCSITLAI